MVRTIGFEILGLGDVKKFMENVSKEVVARADEAITKATFFMEGEVKESIAGHRAEPTSVDTGRFLNSVKGTKTAVMKGKVETNVVYAEFLEYGTSKLSPRAHFRNSISRNKDNIRKFVEVEIKRI